MARSPRFLAWSSVAASAALAGCGAPEEPAPRAVPMVTVGIPYIEDSAGRWFLVDTGTPRTVVSTDVGGAAQGALMERALPSWDIAGLNPGDVPVVVSDQSVGQVRIGPGSVEGVLGMDLLGRQPVTFDPGAAQLIIGRPEELLAGVGPEVAMGVEVLGAGSTCLAEGACYHYGESRVVLPILIDGVKTLALLDTGREITWITESLFAALPVREDRPELALPEAEGLAGRRLTRAMQLEVTAAAGGAAAVQNVTLMLNQEEVIFVKLQVETGRRVEVVLGQSFLRHFATEVDAGARELALHPYPGMEGAFADEFVTIAAVIDEGEGCHPVAALYPGHDAEAKGLQAGDCVTAVDALAATDHPAADLYAYFRERGPGAIVQVVVTRGSEEMTFPVEVEDLLPLMEAAAGGGG